jgi:hypothetical protein
VSGASSGNWRGTSEVLAEDALISPPRPAPSVGRADSAAVMPTSMIVIRKKSRIAFSRLEGCALGFQDNARTSKNGDEIWEKCWNR